MLSKTYTLVTLLFLLLLLTPLQAQQVYNFNPAGATGISGPTQGMVDTAYASTNLNGKVTVVGGIQYWVVPSSGMYKIETWGGQGYGPFGGRGAYMSGEFQLTGGDTLKILPGQKAGDYLNYPSTTHNQQFGGGGGSFVTFANNTPLIISGGGGGNHASAYSTSCDGQITTNGAPGTNSAIVGAGGTNGNGGQEATSADGGGGLLGNGAGQTGGLAFVNGALGGTDNGTGGFGCGGGTSSYNNYRGGGGGGYSGGGGANNNSTVTCCATGGGGGSYNAGTDQDNLAGVNLGDGKIIITTLSRFPNDAGIAEILGLAPPVCAGTYPVKVVVQNFGGNVLNTVTVQWTLNGIGQVPFTYNGLIDTVGGAGNDTVIINLGSVTIRNVIGIKVWTTLPNNSPVDSSAVNDTLELYISRPVIVNAQLNASISCNGAADGALVAGATGGSPSYSYVWSSGAVVPIATNLAAGTYTVTVTDASGCTDTLSVLLAEPGSIVGNDSTKNISCNGLIDGESQLMASGGTLPYNYLWSTGDTTDAINNLSAGNYNYTITDNSGCTSASSITITEPTVLMATASTTDISCNGLNDGEAIVTSTTGSPGYTTAWSNSTNSNTNSNLAAGTYSFTDTDAMGCTASSSVTINEPAALVVTATSTEETVAGNGAVDLTATGGTGAYSFNWSNGATTENLTGVTGGTYAVTVTDANGCTDSISAVVTTTVGIRTAITQLGCAIYPNPTNGQLTVSVDNADADITIEVLDVLGRKVQMVQQASRVTLLEITEKSGVYFVKVTSGAQTHVQRIIVQH